MHFFNFWRLQCTKWTNFTAPKMAKTAVFALLESSKLISRKISVIQKSWYFHTGHFAHLGHFTNFLHFSDTGTTSSNVREELSLKVEASAHIESCFYNTMVVEDENLPMTRITISLSASSPLTKVRVGIDVMEPLVVTKTSFVVNSLSKLISRNFCQNIEKVKFRNSIQRTFRIFLSLRFHEKLSLENVYVQKMPFLQFQGFWIFWFGSIQTITKSKVHEKSKFRSL